MARLRENPVAVAVAAGAAALALAFLVASPAHAYDDSGQGYIDSYQIKEFHAQGIDGSGVTVAVVDSAIYLGLPELQGADIQVKEPSQCYGPGGVEQSSESDDPALALHGTNMVALIVGNGTGYDGQVGITGIAPKAKILYYSVGAQNGCESASGKTIDKYGWDEMVSTAILDATDQGADIINFSIGSGSAAIQDALAYAMRKGVIVVAALENQNSDNLLDYYDGYPSMNNGVLGVGAFDKDGKVLINGSGSPSSSGFVDVVAPGGDILVQGTETDWKVSTIGKGNSAATAITSGNLALAIQKNPNATHNQIIQSLIHNTGTKPHELVFDTKDQYGYGKVDTISLLAADPTEYEDVNPLLLEKPQFNIGPTRDDVYGDPSASPSPPASADASAAPTATATADPAPSEGSSSMMWILIGGGVLLIVVIGVGIAIAIAASKPKNARNQ